MHTLHLLYKDISGQNHDVYQYIYVIFSEEDFDGDGMVNAREACLIGATMGIDRDSDGVDDACDSEIVASANTQKQTTPTNNGDIRDDALQASVKTVSSIIPTDSVAVFDSPLDIKPYSDFAMPIPTSDAAKDVDRAGSSSKGVTTLYFYVMAFIAVLVILVIAYSIKHKRV